MKKIKHVFYAFYLYFINRFISYIPFHVIRNIFYSGLFGKLGKNNSFLMGFEVRSPGNIFIGNNNVFNKDVFLDGRGGKIVIGNNVDIAQETNIWTLDHEVNSPLHETKCGDTIIEDHVWIGSRTTILPGITIGRGAVIGSCSLVTRDVPAMAIVGGVPAKTIGTRTAEPKYTLFYRPWFR